MPQEAREFVQNLRKEYPNPSMCDGVVDEPDTVVAEYCVGGAFCLKLCTKPAECCKWKVRLPNSLTIASALMSRNAELPTYEASRAADLIIIDNDMGRFDAAWQGLEAALCWRDPPLP